MIAPHLLCFERGARLASPCEFFGSDQMTWYGDKQPREVHVYSMRGDRLANTTLRKAFAMVTKKKAVAISSSPLTIKMLIPTGETGKIVETANRQFFKRSYERGARLASSCKFMEVIYVRYGTEQPRGVVVLDIHGDKLENCTHRKARVLTEGKKARVVSMRPYTIQLLNVTSRPKKIAEVEG